MRGVKKPVQHLCVNCHERKDYTIDGGWGQDVCGDDTYFTCPECMDKIRGKTPLDRNRRGYIRKKHFKGN